MRLRSMLAFGLGYLFGSKAGREQYQAISQSLRTIADSDVARNTMKKALGGIGLPVRQDVAGAAKGDGQGSPGEDVTEKPQEDTESE